MSLKRTLNRATLCSSAFLGFALMAAADAYAEQTIYEETFPFTGAFSQDDELRNQGWCGGNAGDPFCANPKDGTPPADNDGGEGAISVGQGEDGAQGFAFWSQTGISADCFLYTDEFTFNSSQLTSVTWYENDSETVEGKHLAFLIGDVWYISDQSWLGTTTWALQEVDLSSLTFFERSTGGDPSTLPGGDVVPGGLELPAGQVNAFGFWWECDKNATSRVDTVRLIGTSVPLFVCYDVREIDKFERRSMTVEDQFLPFEVVDITNASSICTPLGIGVTNTDIKNHLVCHEIIPRRRAGVDVLTDNQFGEQELEVQVRKTLCVPSSKKLW